LASKGLLDKHIPEDYNFLLTIMKLVGLDTEISADICKTTLSIHIAQNNEKGMLETRKSYLRLYFPDLKDEFERLSEGVAKQVIKDGDSMTIHTNPGKSINPGLIKTEYVPK
jgi:thiaminase